MCPYRLDANPGGVTAADLDRLPEVHALLAALDNPSAAVPRVASLCAALPPLAHRIRARAERSAPRRGRLDLESALGLIGNRGLEVLLLELLEELTILHADLDERGR